MLRRPRQRSAPSRPPGAVGPKAYVEPVSEEGETVHVVFTADGGLVGIPPTRSLALYAARQASLEPVETH